MFSLISWIVFGLIVGSIAKFFHTGDEPVGFLETVGIGIAGSFIGGFVHSLLRGNVAFLEPAGLLWSVVGGVIFCFIYSKYLSK